MCEISHGAMLNVFDAQATTQSFDCLVYSLLCYRAAQRCTNAHVNVTGP